MERSKRKRESPTERAIRICHGNLDHEDDLQVQYISAYKGMEICLQILFTNHFLDILFDYSGWGVIPFLPKLYLSFHFTIYPPILNHTISIKCLPDFNQTSWTGQYYSD